MKTAKSIITHLKRHPRNIKVLEIACYEKVKSMLPSHLQSAILFMYKKNQTLYFVLNHPGMKMEFHYKLILIKTLLNKLKSLDENCKDLDILEVKSFVSNKIPPKVEEEKKIQRFYREKAIGTFENRAKNEEIKALFEEIRTLLTDKNDT